MQCTFLTRRTFKPHISFYLQSAPANRKSVRERGRDGGRAGKTATQQGALHLGRLRQKWENEEADIRKKTDYGFKKSPTLLFYLTKYKRKKKLRNRHAMEGCPWLLQTQNVQLTCHPLTHLLSLYIATSAANTLPRGESTCCWVQYCVCVCFLKGSCYVKNNKHSSSST